MQMHIQIGIQIQIQIHIQKVIGKNSTLQHSMACQHRICVAAMCSEQHGLLAYSFYISIHVGYRIWGYLVNLVLFIC